MAADEQGELGGVGKTGAVGDLEVLGEAGEGGFIAEGLGGDRQGFAVGRVEGEARAVEVDHDLSAGARGCLRRSEEAGQRRR